MRHRLNLGPAEPSYRTYEVTVPVSCFNGLAPSGAFQLAVDTAGDEYDIRFGEGTPVSGILYDIFGIRASSTGTANPVFLDTVFQVPAR